jgi:hypothetical protein
MELLRITRYSGLPNLLTKTKLMKTKDEYIESLASELKEWSAQIDLLNAKAERATAQIKLKYDEEIDALRAKQHAASAKMNELENSSSEAWEAVKDSADKIWDELRLGLTSAVSKFKDGGEEAKRNEADRRVESPHVTADA